MLFYCARYSIFEVCIFLHFFHPKIVLLAVSAVEFFHAR